MDQTVNNYATVFIQALGTIRTIRANYYDPVELTEPQSLKLAAAALETVWLSAASGLSSRYPELFTCDGRIKQVRAMLEALHLHIIGGAVNFNLINSPANRDALLVSHVAFESISSFVAVEGDFAFPTYDPAQVGRLMADINAASELLLETYKILRAE